MRRKKEKEVSNRPVVAPAPSVQVAPTTLPTRPALAQLEKLSIVEVTYLKGPGPRRVAGLVVTSTPQLFSVDHVRRQGASHLRALANDPTISVKAIK